MKSVPASRDDRAHKNDEGEAGDNSEAGLCNCPLNYRLNRIKQLTGKNPRHVLDLFELLCGLMWRK
ncbi:hypothetical protein ABES58_01705 [Paenibacillus lautus]|uniref:hypothetical protein n=1 Tax=Paenibacillus lautus TaxID=1401 RepID=UPI003D293A47